MTFIGIDSRLFVRGVLKRDGSEGHFKSVIGIAVRVKDYDSFSKHYVDAIKQALETTGNCFEYGVYNTHDLRNLKDKEKIIDLFITNIAPHIEKVHVFFTLFSTKKTPCVKVFGRKARKEHLRLASPVMTYDELIAKHLEQCFPVVCAWRLKDYLYPEHTQFHLDSCSGHIFEAHEELIARKFTIFVYPNGDALNPIIATADLLIEALDRRLKKK